ncbi:beta-carotene 15,15'-monooxygenase [Peribacillus sp. B-H-3]|uniref:beta-carotene 15,15'-monooxygenase n=1 Tax=Peribacillus sp. B-H-3 TaxID=3400420 RepID=UPI003B02D874
MLVWKLDDKSYIWKVLLILVLGSNVLLYRSPLSPIFLPEEANWIVLGSILDLAIVSPLLLLVINRNKKGHVKRLILSIAGGIILARFLIPQEYFQPYKVLSYGGFAVEGLLLFLELALLLLFMRNLPAIIEEVRQSPESLLFSFPAAVAKKTGKHPIVKAAASDVLMFYYAFLSWRKKPSSEEGSFTLHKNTSVIAFQVMLLHAIVIETIGIHWWLHNHFAVLSLVPLILNICTVIFFAGDIQAIMLNPVKLSSSTLYLSLGLAKKMALPLDNIADITIDSKQLEKKTDSTTTIEFIAKDFEALHPHIILELKEPQRAALFFGIEKTYSRVAICLDNPAKFIEQLKIKIQTGPKHD